MARLDELERKFEESPHRYFASLANEYRKAGEPQRAAAMCRTQLAAIPGHISGHIVLGQALYDSGDYDESRTALERALTLDPENIVALRYLGDIARDTGDVPGAEHWYTRTLEADPYNEAATAALQAFRESASVDSPEIVSASNADDRAIESTASGFESTATVDRDRETDWSVPDEDEEPESPVVLAQVDTVDASSTAEPTDYAKPVAELDPEPEPEPELAVEAAAEDTVDLVPVVESEVTAELPPDVALEDVASDSEPVAPMEEVPEPEPSAAAEEEQTPPEFEQEIVSESASRSAEFAGDLEISAAGESDEPAETTPAQMSEEHSNLLIAAEPPDEPVDVAAHPLPEPVTVEELIQAEERVMESAAPFVTETMADLYLEQGYPHEALELLLQLSEQRPDDSQLRDKIESIKSVIAARRDAAVAAARAERAEATETATTPEILETLEPVAALENAAIADEPLREDPAPAPEPPSPPSPPRSVRELFARMDTARPRTDSAATPRAPARLRSDFVPLPEPRDAQPADDPFGFPDAKPALPPAHQHSILPRTSGPHPMFDPSTAEPDDFDAWLRGLRGP